MKYELPKSLKRHEFLCEDIASFTKYTFCTNRCKACKTNNLDCWKEHVIKDIKEDCDFTNEKNVQENAACPNCQSKRTTKTHPNVFLCLNCGNIFNLDKEQQKICLGENYQEIDEIELNYMIQKASK